MSIHTSDNTGPVNGTVGIVGLPELAAALSSAGVRVITGDDFHKAAIAIRDEISGTGSSFPVLISDVKAPTKRAWANRISGDTALFLINTNTDDPISCDGATDVPTPIEASELLKTIGRGEFAASVDGLMVDADGSVSGSNGGRSDYGFIVDSSIDAELEALLNGDGFDDDEAYDIGSDSGMTMGNSHTNNVVDLPVESEEEYENNASKEDMLVTLMDEPEENDQENENSFAQEPEVVRGNSAPAHLNSMDAYNNFSRSDDPWGDDDDTTTEAPVQPVAVVRPTVSDFRNEAPAPRRERPTFTAPVREPAPAPVVEEEETRQYVPVVEAPAPRRERPTVSGESTPRTSRRERRNEIVQANPFESTSPVVADDDDELFIPAAIFTGVNTKPELPVRRTQPVPEPEVQSHVEEYAAEETYEEEEYAPVVFEPEAQYVPTAAPKFQETVAITGTTPLLFCWGSKGGVGKTTVAMATAQRAAKAGLRVVLIDANRGQGDIRTYLGMTNKDMSSVLDVALGHPIKDSLYGTKTLAAQRNKPVMNASTRKMEAPRVKLNDIMFGLVLAPKARTADPAVVTGAVYNRVINSVRPIVDLVIVDTQTIEVFDTSGLVDSTILPGLVGGGWSLAITDLNVTGTANLRDQLEHFANAGVPKNRTFTLINRVIDTTSPNCTNVGNLLGRFSTYLGAVAVDEEVSTSMNLGQVPELNEEASALIDAALYEITKNPKFDQKTETTTPAASRGGLFRKASK